MRIIDPSFHILDELEEQSLEVRIEYCGRICYKSEERIDAGSAAPFVRKMLQHQHNSVLEMAVLSLQVECRDTGAIQALFACMPRFLQIDRLAGTSLLVTGSIRAFRELWQECHQEVIPQAICCFLLAQHPLFFEDLQPKIMPVLLSGISVRKVPLGEVNSLPVALQAKHRFLAVRFVVNRAVTHELVRHRPCSFLQESQRYCRYSSDRFGNEVTFIRPLFYKEGSPEFELWEQSMKICEHNYLRLLGTSSPQAARSVLPNSCKTEIIVYANISQWQHILQLRTSPAADPSMREVMLPLQAELTTRYPMHFTHPL
ncbi:MAG: FAD-dependent thymidylate synthase [Desulfobulbaceae bacterium]|nr:FAD-dependent thymidylate synthase [Desulfobulbaceae bacterium]